MAKIDTPIPSLKLNDGHSIPMLGFGTGTAWYTTSPEATVDRRIVDSVKMAISMGYTHLDGAEGYNNEGALGTAIKESGVERSKLFVTTKVFETLDDIPTAIETSLKKLQLDYVDLYLIHKPHGKTDQELQTAWAAMEQVQASGKARSIGVSNFQPQHFEVLRQTQKVAPAVNQVEFHAYLQRGALLEYHRAHGIATTAYSPLTNVTKASPGPTDDCLAVLAKKYGVNAGEVALRWCIDRDVVPITTSAKEQRMSDMLRVAKFKLTPKEVADISELGEQKHYRVFWNDIFAKDDRS